MTCDFCYRHCSISDGKYGLCGSRKGQEGRITSPFYGMLAAFAIDPVEKKPLYHFYPGTKTLSIAEEGCNFFCSFCQNSEISQNHREHVVIDEETVVAIAVNEGTPSISYTYSEPLVWQDYMLRTANLARKKGLENIMVSNGSFSDEALSRILPAIDAYNIDLKGDEEFYQKIVKGSSIPVRKAIEKIVKYGSHIEVTTLVIEGIHTSSMIRELGAFLNDAGVSVWHLTRFFPAYMMDDRRATSEEFLDHIYNEALNSGIPFIYKGNTSHESPTKCPRCKAVIDRLSTNGLCHSCGYKLYGKFSQISIL